MNPRDYQRLALVTEFTPDFVRLFDRQTGEPMSAEHNMMVARLIHATLGLASEVGELADMLKKHIIYGKALDLVNIIEETGDVLWYEALALAAVKGQLSDAMEKNIAKLQKRFGDKFTEHAALNRDLPAERKILEGAAPALTPQEMAAKIMQADGVRGPELRQLMARGEDSTWLSEIANILENENYHHEAELIRSLFEA
jgi:NTP pyrophosphatase (non-canonical NTP hydrolase)